MTEQELKKLNRTDLLELLLTVSEENVRLKQALDEAHAQLESRRVDIEEAGSLAEVVMRLNGVFAAAEAACAQYTENIKQLSGRQAKICARMEEETRAHCAQMLAEADRAANAARRRSAMRAPVISPQKDEAHEETPTIRTPHRRTADG